MTDTIPPVSPLAQQQVQNAKAPTTNQDYDMFLKLLTTQMKNQDPTNPMDPTQFVSQLATFSQVEQATQTNQKMDQLASLFAGSLSRLDLGYIGMNVESKIDTFKYNGTDVDFRYASSGASKVNIAITNAAGEVVRTVEGSTETGEQHFVWDGKDDMGVVVPQSDYKISVKALDDAGKELEGAAVVSMRGIVNEVITENGVSILVYDNGTAVDSSQVVGIKKDTPIVPETPGPQA